ncbi:MULTISPECIES: TcmI family type II polyketide cyclase [unclassified Streptomyces]|uniref:TcmI family type II polyketide cyclase n=1 Tax=unclassified Streptomyces TaxID=2593676 RepID=UPI0033A9424A
MHRALIVARMMPGAEDDVAAVFAASDRGELPDLVGATSRSLFRFRDVYLHLIEADRPLGPAVAAVRDHPAFRSISRELDPMISPYDPGSWRGPADAMAQEFYRWERGAGEKP